MAQDSTRDARTGVSWRWSIALVLFLAIGGFFLLSEHRAHGFYLLAWLLLLACPLLHFWMHGNHGSHDQGTGPPGERDRGAHQH
jgi:hypothetical protein